MAAKAADVATIAGRSYWRLAEGRAIVAEWRRSGESQRRFAERWGIGRGRLARWVARVERSAERGAVTFHPVRIGPAPAAESPAATVIEIAWPDGAVVRVSATAPAAAIRRVVRALRAGAAR